jgi:hypothetical protein
MHRTLTKDAPNYPGRITGIRSTSQTGAGRISRLGWRNGLQLSTRRLWTGILFGLHPQQVADNFLYSDGSAKAGRHPDEIDICANGTSLEALVSGSELQPSGSPQQIVEISAAVRRSASQSSASVPLVQTSRRSRRPGNGLHGEAKGMRTSSLYLASAVAVPEG